MQHFEKLEVNLTFVRKKNVESKAHRNLYMYIYVYIYIYIYIYIYAYVYVYDSSVWLGLASREQLMSPEC